MENENFKNKATQVTGCKTCKKGLSNSQKSLVVFSIYILIACVVGTIEIFKYLAKFFY
jgi:hypothetical protein